MYLSDFWDIALLSSESQDICQQSCLVRNKNQKFCCKHDASQTQWTFQFTIIKFLILPVLTLVPSIRNFYIIHPLCDYLEESPHGLFHHS